MRVRRFATRKPRWIFAHSAKDGILVLLSCAELALIVFISSAFPRLSGLTLLLIAAIAIFVNCTNFQCIAHNFLHLPFFRSKLLNQIFSVLNTLPLGVPQSLYRLHHLNHHKYNSDVQDPETGSTKDYSSIYRFSRKSGEAESIWSYAMIGPLRSEFAALYEEAKKQGSAGQVWLETAALILFMAALCFSNYQFFIVFYLPVWYLGQASARAENYLEHYRARPGNRMTDSVSCYNRLYNLIWFNNGYHQEHHFRMQVHWSKIQEVRALMLPENNRRVVRGAHWFNAVQ